MRHAPAGRPLGHTPDPYGETMQYLAYGSNLHPARMGRRVPSARALGAVSLTGWALRFHKRGGDGSGKCNVQPTSSQGHRVYGVVYEIARAEKADLDRIEGLGRGYEERTVDLPDFGRVFFYSAAPGHVDEELRPFDWYHRFVVDGARHHRFPAWYVRHLEAVVPVPDPDRARDLENRRILALLGVADRGAEPRR